MTWNQQGVGGGGGSEIWLTVVGVVDAVRFGGMDDATGIDVYAPHSQVFAGDSYFILKTAIVPASLQPQVRSALDGGDDCGGSLGGAPSRAALTPRQCGTSGDFCLSSSLVNP